ncbi:MAG TPA: hypothetical protein VF109_06130 [Mycobacteriales bacterium]
MLSTPVYDQIEGITIYRNDERRGHFFYVPRSPRIVVGRDGKPQFTFYRYQNPIERSGPEKGGGYLLFTTSMAEDQQLLDMKVVPRLRAAVAAEDPADLNPPPVSLSPVPFTGGTVTLVFLSSTQFVKAITLGRPSLVGDQTASVAVELTEDGAQLLYEGLMHGAGVAAIEYDLTYQARLPAIQVRGHISSAEVKTATMAMTADYVADTAVWGDNSHTDHHRTSISEVMHNQGLVHLEILKGDVDLTQEDENAIRTWAFAQMDAFVKKNFLSGGSVETAEDRKDVWMQYLHADATNDFTLDVTMRDVITYPYNPSAQIGAQFLGVDPKTVVVDVDLQDAPWYRNLDVQANTSLDWDRFGDVVHSVVADFRYDKPRRDGSRSTAAQSLVFTAADTAAKSFKAHVAEVGLDDYTVDVTVHYKSGPTRRLELGRVSTNKRAYTVEVPNPGLIDVDFAVDPGVFGDKLSSIEIEVRYGDAARKVADVTETVVLNAAQSLRTYRRWIYAPFDKPLQYRTTYVIENAAGDEQRSTGDWVVQEAAPKMFVTVHSPFDDVFSLRVIPSVDWTTVSSLLVDLQYDDDQGDLHQQTTLAFTAEAGSSFQDWRFPLLDAGRRAFRYRQTLLLVNAGRESGDWVTVTSNPGTLVVGNAPGGVVQLQVDPADTGIGVEVKRVIARLSYTDPPHRVVRAATLVFRDATPQTWSIARADPAVNPYRYDVDYIMADGSRRTLAAQRGELPPGGLSDYLALPVPPAGP